MKTDDVSKLLERMPRRVRDHVAKLNEEIAQLKEKLEQRAEKPTLVAITSYADNGQERQFLPSASVIRFYLSEKDAAADFEYVDVEIAKHGMGLQLRSSGNALVTMSGATNSVFVRQARWSKDGYKLL